MADAYAQLALHRLMLRDELRNEAYRRAIAQVVKPGQVVLDMGAGTGILSIFAAQAGARKVYAVERTDIVTVAREMVARNGFADRIEVIHADLEDVDLPEKVEVIISEWMGGLGVDENMLTPLVLARNRWLVSGGKIVPERVTAWLAPAWMHDLDEGLAHWRARPHGVDMTVIADISANDLLMTQAHITTDDLLAPPQMLWTHDAYTCSLAEADRSFVSTQVFTAARTGKLSALATWFTADMCDGCVLTNAVGAPDTHWGRIFFPLKDPIEITEGARIQIELRCDPSTPGICEFDWSVKVGDGATERHDTRPHTRLR
jgi:SAM-dependent methyltransferase